mmetsp:Transcript_16312/g.21948  ORF Transcript_16312/g.21948 Transcript_16312/m.21948 type:complete len:286 (+) Transcript_16312:89-946(+)
MAARIWQRLASGPLSHCGVKRAFGTDGPFRHIKPSFVERKKHYNELLIFGDRRKLLETAQDVLSNPYQKLPRPFWEILAKRCIQSAHLLEPLELAIIARAFDMHDVDLGADLDIYESIAAQAKTRGDLSGISIAVLADVLPRRLASGQADIKDLLGWLGRRAADVMWELDAAQAVAVLTALTLGGVQDAVLCSRVARKVLLQLEGPGVLQLDELAQAAAAFAGQGHRDLHLFRSLTARTAALATSAPAGASAAKRVLESLAVLGIDDTPESIQCKAIIQSQGLQI